MAKSSPLLSHFLVIEYIDVMFFSTSSLSHKVIIEHLIFKNLMKIAEVRWPGTAKHNNESVTTILEKYRKFDCYSLAYPIEYNDS